MVPVDLNVATENDTMEISHKIREFYLGKRPVSEETAEEMIYLLTDEMFMHGIVGAAR